MRRATGLTLPLQEEFVEGLCLSTRSIPFLFGFTHSCNFLRMCISPSSAGEGAGQGIPPHRVGCHRFVSTWTWMYASISGSESNPEQAVALFAERPCLKMKMEARANTRFAGSEFGRSVVADAYPSLI